MKRFTEILSGGAAMLFQVALTGWLFCMAKMNFEFEAMALNYLPLCALLLLAYGMDSLMLRRGLPVPVFAVAQIAFIALGAWLFAQCVYLQPFKTGTVVFGCIIYCLSFIVACYVAWMPVGENGVLLRFDALAAMLILLLVLDEVLVLPAANGAVLMCAVSLVLTLFASVSLRSGKLSGRGHAVHGDPVVGRVMLALVLGIMLLLAFLVVLYATSGMKSISEFLLDIINTCVGAVKAALLWLYGLLESFMRWLSRFASDAPMASIGAQQGTAVIEPELAPGELAPVPGWIYPTLIVLGVALLAFIIFRMRHLRVGRVRRGNVSAQLQKRDSGLKKALLDALRRLKAVLVFRWRSLRYAKTAPGLLVWCEKKVEPDKRRRADESGESFLRRLAESGYGEELSAALQSLALCVECSFYSPVPVSVPADVYKTVKHGRFKTEKTDVS